MEFTLHVWGPIGELPSFDPDCLAAIWYMSLAAKDRTVAVPSSNTWIDPKGQQLPALKHGDHTVAGFSNIVRYMKAIGYDIDQGLSEDQRGKCTGLVSYINSNVAVLSLFTLYLNRENYESIVRPAFSDLLPFPMQYNAPLTQRKLAKSRCAAAGFDDRTNPSDSNSNSDNTTISLGKIHDQLEAKKSAQKQKLDDAKDNLKALTFGRDVYITVTEALDYDLPSITTADVLLMAHLTIQMSESFPDAVMKTLIESQFPKILAYYKSRIGHLSGLVLESREPTGDETPGLLNTLRGYLLF